MKSVGELTELEATKLKLAQSNLKDAASAFALARVHAKSHLYSLDHLFKCAREFDAACEEVGMHEYWIRRNEDDMEST